MTEADVITVRKMAICPSCGMSIEKGAEMYRSLKMPNRYVCLTCAIREQEELKRKRLRRSND